MGAVHRPSPKRSPHPVIPVQDLAAGLQEHIHSQNSICKDVQRTLSEPKQTSVTDKIRDLQQVGAQVLDSALFHAAS